ncbi:enoyl-CoA hydratase-related protein [Actinacidiphila sp. bgisy144]|uniref:enoyl-CoA hydratase-related protein n=1 Tax=Actinacidiphila sp. bgisy144 TaxID=3413791 RepID=UPI003EB8D03A
MAEFATIRYGVASHVATVTLDRPEARNGFTVRMAEELAAALRAADADDGVRAVVLSGAGRSFCVGADLTAGDDGERAFGAKADRAAEAAVAAGTYLEPAGVVTSVMYRMDKPVIAAVHGAAAGAGATMLLPADFRLAAEGTKFAFPFTRRGVVPEGASAWWLPRIVGLTRAMDWLISGRTFLADEALAAGLLTSVHPADELTAAAHALAAELAREVAPLSVALTRRLVYRLAWADSPEPVHRADSRLVHETVRGPDAAEGVASYFEQRAPHFPTAVPGGLPAYAAAPEGARRPSRRSQE